MKLTPFAKQVAHFHRKHQLQGTPSLPVTDGLSAQSLVAERLKLAQEMDGSDVDLDPMPGQVFRSVKGYTYQCSFSRNGSDLYLNETNIHYRECQLLMAFGSEHQLDVLQTDSLAYVHQEEIRPQTLTATRLDLRTQKATHQYLEVEAEPCKPYAEGAR